MQLVAPDAPILRKVCRADFVITADQINGMFFLMREVNGLGLAASQVGIDARLFITHWNEIFVNPQIIERRVLFAGVEGCLSLPGIIRRKQRYQRITLADGRTYSDRQAVVIQHEIEHLNGRLITDEDFHV